MSKPLIIVGCGYAGAVIARIIAEEQNRKVIILEKRNHIAGNMYDKYDDSGVLVHCYGPHISVMNEDCCFDFLSRFTEWLPYHHRVNALIDGKEVPLPFNFTALELLFPPRTALVLRDELIATYGFGANVPILTMLQAEQPRLKDLAEYIYEKVFLHYTMKMWGIRPDEISPAVTGRIPVRLSYDNRHFQHKYQVMPKNGFVSLFSNILSHPNIEIELNCNATEHLQVDYEHRKVIFDGRPYNGDVVYTGALDELSNYDLGELPYRSLKFKFETMQKDYVQSTPVLNWPDSRKATRRTEMKQLTQQNIPDVTTTITEYPGAYNRHNPDFNVPYYPLITDDCLALHQNYVERLAGIKNFYLAGRLADYKYYNMETTIMTAFDVADTIKLAYGEN